MANDIEDDGGDEGGEHDAQQLSLDHNESLKILKVDLFHANSEKNNSFSVFLSFPVIPVLFFRC